MPIRVLEDDVIARIAAGEVVERPASVVRELVDNALDAGASRIDIRVEAGGRRLIEVADDGHGIPAADLELAFQRHATSKLWSVDDLDRIQTLGFRGEALASIAAVSRLRIRSRFRDEQTGNTLLLEDGEIVERASIGSPPGTSVTVENLFHNVPARQKFLSSPLAEKRQITLLLSRYALVQPQVRFTLTLDDRESFRSSGNGVLADSLVSVLGRDVARDMLRVGPHIGIEDAIRVCGFVSSPALHRSDRSRILLFVNGRHVQDASLAYAVIQAYHTLLMKGRFPVAVLMISLPPEQVDVNVHPAKAEVRFQRPREVFSALLRAVRATLMEAGGSRSGPGRNALSPRVPVEDSFAGIWQDSQTIARKPLFADEQATVSAATGSPATPQRPRSLPMLRVIGQIGASFIVAEGPAGMYLIDQHAAHERILYEEFLDRQEREETMSQFTLAGETLELPPSDASLIASSQEQLRAIGLELEPFGPNTFLIRSIPAMLADQEPREVLRGVLEELERDQQPGKSALEQRLIRRVCKQAAVKAGTVLGREEMQGLVRQLERTQSPLTCPHGRPTLLHMSAGQLAREFGRH
ncbi:MAG: DNA mismatch repair endonuclease MutL [Anaerolineaceae bacterium]|nr:DNA mismatch repair endonuclease MutL [Anaerolineaceae bacterium]